MYTGHTYTCTLFTAEYRFPNVQRERERERGERERGERENERGEREIERETTTHHTRFK